MQETVLIYIFYRSPRILTHPTKHSRTFDKRVRILGKLHIVCAQQQPLRCRQLVDSQV